ncbi:Insulin-like growth factor-binding protein 3 [Heterocephalus glaber]|uniref:Insulin-like growth factor-binding protein 3 n=1 Tax=Heterocephalus glaber TaxID=10181 RepID=G5BIM5_HETGA|nr:Insulin-like growth factor-binding protein 3 [Heterocephalus glaber]
MALSAVVPSIWRPAQAMIALSDSGFTISGLIAGPIIGASHRLCGALVKHRMHMLGAPTIQCPPVGEDVLPGKNAGERLQEFLFRFQAPLAGGHAVAVSLRGSGTQCSKFRACSPTLGPRRAALRGRRACNILGRKAESSPDLAGVVHPEKHGNASESEEDPGAGSVETQAIPSTHRVTDSKFHTLHTKMDVIRKGHAKDSQRYKVDYESQSTDTQNFSSESKRETEYGPCRREMEDTLNHLKFLNVLSPRGVHIPNCDKKGFYKKKQCRPSKGRKRGFCWCVDKYGQPLPGYDSKGKEDVHCLSMHSQ